MVRAGGLREPRIYRHPPSLPMLPRRAMPSARRRAAAEALQAIVRRRMTADPVFAGQSLDFGTAPDGSVEVWLNGQGYAGVDRIPDPRLRELIARSADEFNRGDAAPR